MIHENGFVRCAEWAHTSHIGWCYVSCHFHLWKIRSDENTIIFHGSFIMRSFSAARDHNDE